MLGALVFAGLAVVAILAVMAPTANAGKDRTLKQTFTLPNDLHIDDAWLSQACGFDVSATVGGTFERKLVLGTDRNPAAHET